MYRFKNFYPTFISSSNEAHPKSYSDPNEHGCSQSLVGSTGDRHPKIMPPIIGSNNFQRQHWINIVWMPSRAWDF